MGTGRLKAGAPVRGERVERYYRLLRFEEEMGDAAGYPGRAAFGVDDPHPLPAHLLEHTIAGPVRGVAAADTFKFLRGPVWLMRRRRAVDEALAWHALDRPTLLDRLESSAAGLSDEEAARRLRRFGLNRLPERPSLALLYLTQF